MHKGPRKKRPMNRYRFHLTSAPYLRNFSASQIDVGGYSIDQAAANLCRGGNEFLHAQLLYDTLFTNRADVEILLNGKYSLALPELYKLPKYLAVYKVLSFEDSLESVGPELRSSAMYQKFGTSDRRDAIKLEEEKLSGEDSGSLLADYNRLTVPRKRITIESRPPHPGDTREVQLELWS